MAASEIRELSDPSRPHHTEAGPRPVRLHLHRPQRPGHAPLGLLSHGTGGSAEQMAWLAEPLAEAGFLVAAVDHHGNNYRDGATLRGFAFWADRPRDLSFVLDHLLEREQVGPVGAAGFSLGGYTAAALAGVRLARRPIEAALRGEYPLPSPPEYPTPAEELLALPAEATDTWPQQLAAGHADPRVRCAFLVAPALGEIVDTGAPARPGRPVAVRWSDADTVVPPGTVRRSLDALPGAEGRSVGADVDHYAFLCRADPDSPFHDAVRAGAPVRARVAAEVVEFFRRHLR
ncbi:alpha/beta hydrolase family protein [Thermobifida cellulosilytica]|uniref:alpha/beta hydrolase family protein n=1 Tax=Thermobifida cellulosilytica TaxID=144786 RepID=UPI000837D475|nr:alpha/beta hydrolase [Thermobifida cellulosilytica]